jgi:predicted ribosome quality control (RQC) complex YloA/Tae2 family protein
MVLDVPVASQEQKMSLKDLDQEKLDELMQQYMDQVKAEKKYTQHGQFLLMKAQLVEEGTINLLSPTSITDAYAQSHRTELQEFIKEATGLLMRITTSFTETEPEHKEKTLTRTEIFNEMAAKNPSLLHLRDGMKMSIEY